MTRPRQSRGVHPDTGNGATYQEHTRNQSNGGRSLYPEHFALYQKDLEDGRNEKELSS